MDLTHEEWRAVIGYEGLYEVSDLGRVRSLDRVVRSRWPSGRPVKGRILACSIGPTTGYRTVALADAESGRKLYYALVHRLVLEAFRGPCPPGHECCHADLDRSNEALSNLRWDTRSANTLDAVRHRTNHHAKKTTCPNGHKYDGFTTSKNGMIGRYCKRCKAARDKERWAARRIAS